MRSVESEFKILSCPAQKSTEQMKDIVWKITKIAFPVMDITA